MVSTHSRPKAAGPPTVRAACMSLFQHTAARRRLLAAYTPCLFRTGLFQHTAARRRLIPSQRLHQPHRGFNTQPPEGGWIGLRREVDFRDGFNTQPPEGGWSDVEILESIFSVSTHSRPKAAGCKCARAKSITKSFQHTAARRRLPITTTCCGWLSSFNTQPPEGGWDIEYCRVEGTMVSTHSRPKAAGPPTVRAACMSLFQHTAARRRLGLSDWVYGVFRKFQHTAARRRLEMVSGDKRYRVKFQHTVARRRLGKRTLRECARTCEVSTHSRPKAAGSSIKLVLSGYAVSTHSRPKAAGFSKRHLLFKAWGFNTQPPEGGWLCPK